MPQAFASDTFDPASTQRTFRLAMSDYGAAIVLPGLIRTLRRDAPGIALQISHASCEGMLDGLVNGDIDLAAGVFPELPNDLRSAPLFEEHFACLVDRSSLPVEGALDVPGYLARPHVLLEMRGSGTPEIERALTTIGEPRHIAVSLPHWSVAPQFISGTDLIFTVASRALHGIDAQQLRVLAPPFHIPSFDFVLAWHQRRGGDVALNWLKAQIEQAIVRA